MFIPNASQAVIAPEKLRDYLLSLEHRRGGTKARVLRSMGFRADNWPELESEIRVRHLTAEADITTESGYGPRYEIVAPLVGPNGRAVRFRSIWQIDSGTDRPRLITIYPE